MKKILILSLLLLLLSLPCLAGNEILVGTPIVDGVLDHMYLESYALTVTGEKDTFHTGPKGKTDGSKGDSATAYYLYNENTLYICIDVKDDKVYSRGKAWVTHYIDQLSWENDAVEARIYYPELGNPERANQYIFQCDAKSYATTNYQQLCPDPHTATATLNEKGFTVEFAVPLSFDKKAGDEIGLCVEIDDLHEMVQGISTGMNKCNFNAYGSQEPYKNMVKLGSGKASSRYTVFDDTKNHAAMEDISYVVQADIFNGTGDGFQPDGTMTRAMFATVIGRLYERKNGELIKYDNAVKFKDADYNSWYGKYLDWASGSGIVNGVGDGLFAPDAPVTKQQMAVMLYRFAKAFSSDVNITFADANDVAQWAKIPVSYCLEKGYIKGDANNKFYPKSNAKRHEVASLVTAYMQSVKAKLYE